MNIKKKIAENLSELNELVACLEEGQLAEVRDTCLTADRIFFSGMGRSGNMVKALAIRFMHLGYQAFVAGDAATPAIGEGDVLIAVSSSGKTKVTMNHLEVARQARAKTVLVSAQNENDFGADVVLCIPARTRVASTQHAGSLFEQGVLVIGDGIAAAIQAEKQVASEYMNGRHANLQ